jgi:hypothetical protein
MGGILDGSQQKSGLGRYWSEHGVVAIEHARIRIFVLSVSSTYFPALSWRKPCTEYQVGSLVRTRDFRKIGSGVFEMRRDKGSHLFMWFKHFRTADVLGFMFGVKLECLSIY